ncbi:MAG: hypothetical protein IT331_23605 [Anaerolineae bacterium]|nr:hypothetical protein [Anaerolineae bacterium]
MKSANRMSLLVLAIVLATIMATIIFSPVSANRVEPPQPTTAPFARPPQQDPTPPPPPPPDDGGIIQNIFQNITQTVNFPFVNLVEALQSAIEEILRRAMEPIQMMFEAVLSLWLENPGILSSGNAALPGWDLMKDAWQFMYSIAIAFWPLTLAVVAAIAAKDAVAAATWGLGDLKTALGTWFAAVLLSATSLWWMDLANNLANAITSYILYNFAGPQFFPGTFMVFFTVVLPGLFLTFPLAGIIIIIFLVILAITIFVGLTFAIIARLVLMYLLVALGPLAIILGVLPPLRFATQMWVRGLLLVLALGPIDALLLKLAFNVAQYASSAPPLQAVAAFIGVFGLLSILITINFTLVKTVFGAVIAVANQTMSAVQAVGQMAVAGALLMTGAGAGAALGGSAAGGAATGGGAGGGVGGSGGALGGGLSNESGNSSGGMATPSTLPGMGNANGAGRGNGNSPWQPRRRGMSAAGNYLQSTRGPLAGFGALLRAAGVEQLQQERGIIVNGARNNMGMGPSMNLESRDITNEENESPLTRIDSERVGAERQAPDGASDGAAVQRTERNALRPAQQDPHGGDSNVPARTGSGTDAAGRLAQGELGREHGGTGTGTGGAQSRTPRVAVTRETTDVRGAVEASRRRVARSPIVDSTKGNVSPSRGAISSGVGVGTVTASSPGRGGSEATPAGLSGRGNERAASGAGSRTGISGVATEDLTPPRRANIAAIQESRAAMGFDSGAREGANAHSIAGASTTESASSSGSNRDASNDNAVVQSGSNAQEGESADAGTDERGTPIEYERAEEMINDSTREPANDNTSMQSGSSAQEGESSDAAADERGTHIENVHGDGMLDDSGSTLGVESPYVNDNEIIESNDNDNSFAARRTPSLAHEADRTLSMLPEGSDEARGQAAQLVSRYADVSQQSQTAIALEQAMHTVHEQNSVPWSQMGGAMERGLWSTQEAANNGIPLNDMARQMEPFIGSRDPSDYLAWQIAGRGEKFHLPSQQVAYLPAPGPYEYQAGQYIEQQLGMAMGYQDAAKMFYVIRDPSTAGGGWSKGQAFIGEVHRISRSNVADSLMELDRWMQANAPTRARLMWNMHFKVVNGK